MGMVCSRDLFQKERVGGYRGDVLFGHDVRFIDGGRIRQRPTCAVRIERWRDKEVLPSDEKGNAFSRRGLQGFDDFTVRHLIGALIVDAQQAIIDLQSSIFIGNAVRLQRANEDSTT